jgi:HlyD family secretion protein
MQNKRKLIILAIMAAVVLLVVHGFMPGPVEVDVAKAGRGPLSVYIEEEGKTRVKDRFVISSPVAGYLKRIVLEVGDGVKKGQVVFEIAPLRSTVLDPRSRAEAEARVKAAEARLHAAKEEAEAASSDAAYAEKELERIQGLFESGYTSKDTLDLKETNARQARANLKSSKFAVDVAAHELEAARTALRYSAAEATDKPLKNVPVKTPVEGRVLKVLKKSEGVVVAGEAILEVGDPRALEVEVDVLSEDSVRISSGTRVLFERWGGEAPLEGRVKLIEPVGFTKVSALGIEEQRVLVISDFASPSAQWERLGDGYRVEARFMLWEGQDVLQVPQSAIFRHGGGWAVFIIENKRARLRPVELGHKSGLRAEILSGLEGGEEVINHPDNSIEDNTRVKRR